MEKFEVETCKDFDFRSHIEAQWKRGYTLHSWQVIRGQFADRIMAVYVFDSNRGDK